MRKGKIIGESERLVIWHKPHKCSKGLSKSELAALPLTLTVREIYYYILIPDFRTQQGAFNYHSIGHKNLSNLGNC